MRSPWDQFKNMWNFLSFDFVLISHRKLVNALTITIAITKKIGEGCDKLARNAIKWYHHRQPVRRGRQSGINVSNFKKLSYL